MIWLLSALSGVLYRLGGMGQDGIDTFPHAPEWLFDTKARDIGCGFCTIGAFFALGLHVGLIWWHVLVACLVTIVAMLGALSTYWDFMFGDKDNFWMHGFMCGLALFPLAIITGNWLAFGIRCVILALAMGVLAHLTKLVEKGGDVLEEFSRGLLLPITIYIMII